MGAGPRCGWEGGGWGTLLQRRRSTQGEGEGYRTGISLAWTSTLHGPPTGSRLRPAGRVGMSRSKLAGDDAYGRRAGRRPAAVRQGWHSGVGAREVVGNVGGWRGLEKERRGEKSGGQG